MATTAPRTLRFTANSAAPIAIGWARHAALIRRRAIDAITGVDRGLPGWSACVAVGPPFEPSGPTFASVFVKSPGLWNPQLSPLLEGVATGDYANEQRPPEQAALPVLPATMLLINSMLTLTRIPLALGAELP